MKKGLPKILNNICSNFVIIGLLVLVFCASFAFNDLSAVFSNGTEKVIYNGNKTINNVSLMINVYTGNEYIEPILNVLDEYGVKITFFVGGCWVAKNEELFSKIVMAGHEIGNHGYFHKDHANLNYDANYNEILVTHKLVKQLTGVEMKLFAPPSGSFSSTTLAVASELGYSTIMWSKDTIDWRDKDENLVYSRATKNISNGDLILMHPTQHTLNALGRVLNYFKSKNFNVVTVGENINFHSEGS